MKKSNVIIKFLAILIILFLVKTDNIYAENIDDEIQLEEELGKIAIEWVKQNNSDLEVDNFVKIYSLDNQLIAYSISYKMCEKDYGYIIYNLNENRIIEFLIDENTKDIYNSILDNLDIEDNLILNQLYYIGNNEYAVEVIDDEGDFLISNYYNEYDISIINKQDTANTLNNWYDIIKDISLYSGSASYSKVMGTELNNQICLSQSYIESTCKKYACAVVAMLEICIQNEYFSFYIPGTNAYYPTKIAQAFNYLWNESGTTVYETKGNIQYGGTSRANISSAIISFVKYYISKTITCTVKQSPSYNDFVSAVNAGKSSILSVEIKLKSGNTSHAVSVLGYAVYRSYANNQYIYFLKIADGWTDKPRYITYDISNFVSYQAVIVN